MPDKEAILKIYGDIGEHDMMLEMFGVTDDTTSAKKVSDFLDENKDAKELTVKINSRGGDVQEGWAIHDLLVNSGMKVKTIGEGKIYSIATVIFLAGEEREIMKNADGLIHNPYIPPYTLADQYESDDLLKIAEGLQQEEEKILDYYVQRTGSPKEKLAEYMEEDTKLSAEDMLSLGFATKIIEPVKAYAFIKPQNNFKMDEKKFFEKLGSTLDKFADKIKNFSRLDPADMTITDKDGKEIKIEKESGDPAVGDKASPDGTFTLANGKTLKIENGAITEIVEETASEDMVPAAELDQAKAKIAELEQLLGDTEAKSKELTEAKTAADQAKAKAEKRETEAKALYDELSTLKNSWKPSGRVKINSVDKVGDVNLAKVRELKEKIIDKKE